MHKIYEQKEFYPYLLMFNHTKSHHTQCYIKLQKGPYQITPHPMLYQIAKGAPETCLIWIIIY